MRFALIVAHEVSLDLHREMPPSTDHCLCDACQTFGRHQRHSKDWPIPRLPQKVFDVWVHLAEGRVAREDLCVGSNLDEQKWRIKTLNTILRLLPCPYPPSPTTAIGFGSNSFRLVALFALLLSPLV